MVGSARRTPGTGLATRIARSKALAHGSPLTHGWYWFGVGAGHQAGIARVVKAFEEGTATFSVRTGSTRGYARFE
ncbi:hypothetical protein AOZ06_18290 [Kibdelosporangium phytohabitans]|uniref:Uncharacterized protein n=1 Tax=Kibdelosporangium phytohabitans TaxID=860235 RepID=A0A0N9HZ24_9PSEU|nr:hypothetical protein AOZ06_18290 [Kibdelosporangium phytohabitans]